MSLSESITVVTEPTAEYLDQKQLVNCRSEREDCLSWFLTLGNEPKKANGYAVGTVNWGATQVYEQPGPTGWSKYNFLAKYIWL